jgi:glycosyltransferase involved in cell wall biosynthesis
MELGNLLDAGDSFREIDYAGPNSKRWAPPLTRYFRRYVGYQRRAGAPPADVYHVLDHGYGHLALSLPPSRVVVTFHDAMLLHLRAGELNSDRYPWLAILGQRLSLRGVRRAARVIVDSESSRNDFLRFVPFDQERVVVVPLGVAERYKPVDPGRWESRLGPRPRLLHVGHTGFYKNVEGLIRALALLATEGQPATLVKVGADFTPAQERLIRELGVIESIQRLGHISDEELPCIYSAVDALVTPSFSEGFGLPALEAMACGTPVVASVRGSFPEVIGDAGVLVDPERPEDIAAGILRLLHEPGLRESLVGRGRTRAAGLSWRRTAESTLAVYRQVAGEN